jgi:hypothetical protein
VSEDLGAATARAFPQALADEVGLTVPMLRGSHFSPSGFDVVVGGERLTIPHRLYSALTPGQWAVPSPTLACLLTRHHNGYVRAQFVETVLALNTPWSIPYLIALIGEYVVQILDQIDARFDEVDPLLLALYFQENPSMLALTQARVTSYWACYYRSIPREEYVGFRLVRRIEALAKHGKD